MREPAEPVEDLERRPELPPGSEERFMLVIGRAYFTGASP